jgi:cysteinyl-tRNA synthetase
MRLTNTLSGQKEEFIPGGSPVKMYVCGPTPYDSAHIGHAMSYVVFDVLRRYLEYRGYAVKHVQNFTDIDDKIIARAREAGVSPFDLAEKYIAEFFRDMDDLNVARAHVYPRVTREIPDIIAAIKSLVEKGFAYVTPAGNVYFSVRKYPRYGELSHRRPDEMLAGARVEAGEDKADPLDFALWKAARPGEPAWESPWGPGRPGWHIECSVMSRKYLGDQLDIHGGGQDLIFPHHENERAQSEALTGHVPFVRYWVHNGLLQLGGEKMSKSLGNLITVREALERYSADGLRVFILSSHYRRPLLFSEEAVQAAARGAERLRFAAREPARGDAPLDFDPDGFRARFIEAMDDDLNTPEALAALFDLAREVNRAREAGRNIRPAQEVLLELAGVLGLRLEIPAAELAAPQLRADLHKQVDEGPGRKLFDLSDRIRDRLRELGIILEDTPQGTVWRVGRGG